MIGLQSKKIVIALAIFLSATMTAPVVTTAAAGPGESEGAANDSPAKAASTSNGGDSGKSESSTPAPNPDPVVELQELKANVEAEAQRVAEQTQELDNERAALRDELQGIAALEAKLGIVPNPSSTPDATASIANPASTPNAANQGSPTQTITPQDSSNRIANLESRLKNFGPFQFSGDIRLRGEPFLGGPADRSQDRDRARYRVRFNIVAKLNDDISGGITLASGDINDPTTTNQTITGFYSRKTIAIDKAYVNYNPHEFKNLTLIGGKFGYPWYNTELTWDKDLNPEGFAQTLVFNPDIPVLKRIAFVGFELPFAEVAGVSLNDKSIVQSVTYGGQIQTTWQLAHWLKFGAFTGFYNFHNADPIALALAKASAKNPQTPLTGSLPLGTGNTVQNSIVTSTSTNIVTIGGTAFPTGVTTITNAHRSLAYLTRSLASTSQHRGKSGPSHSLATTFRTPKRAPMSTISRPSRRTPPRSRLRRPPTSLAIRTSVAVTGQKRKSDALRSEGTGSLITPAFLSSGKRFSRISTTAIFVRAAT